MKVSILKLNDKTMGVLVNHYDVIETLMTTYSKSVSSISGRGEGKTRSYRRRKSPRDLHPGGARNPQAPHPSLSKKTT